MADSVLQSLPITLQRDLWFAKDKADHFLVSAFLTGCAYYVMRSGNSHSEPAGKNLAVGFSISLGLLKEIYDGFGGRGTPSFKDLAADIAGTSAGYLLCSFGER